MTRFTIDPKSPIRPEDLAIILLHAGRKGKKPCALSVSCGNFLINQQISIIRGKFGPSVEIIAVLGYCIDEIERELNQSVRIVENENFLNSSSARSAMMGIRATTKNVAYIIHGDLIFDDKVLLPDKNSYVLTKSRNNDREVGVVGGGGYVENLAYGLSECPAWAGLAFLQEQELKLFKQFYKSGMLMHEVFNAVVDNGGRIAIK